MCRRATCALRYAARRKVSLALRAGEPGIVGVNPQVLLQGGRRGKALGTDGAGVTELARVNVRLMRKLQMPGDESGGTDAAAPGTLHFLAKLPVLLQALGSFEFSLATLTGERIIRGWTARIRPSRSLGNLDRIIQGM